RGARPDDNRMAAIDGRCAGVGIITIQIQVAGASSDRTVACNQVARAADPTAHVQVDAQAEKIVRADEGNRAVESSGRATCVNCGVAIEDEILSLSAGVKKGQHCVGFDCAGPGDIAHARPYALETKTATNDVNIGEGTVAGQLNQCGAGPE